MAKKLCLVCQLTPSSFQICKEVRKPCRGRAQGWLSFLDECPKYIFSAAQTEQLLFRGWTGSCAPGDKKAQNGSFVGLHPVSQLMPQQLQNVLKKQKGHASYWISEYMYLIEK